MANHAAGMTQIQCDGYYRAKPVTQTATPTTGQTVNVTATSSDVNLWLSPAGTLANLTIALPAEATSQIGQIVSYGSSQIITTLVVSVAGGSVSGIVGNLSIGDFYAVQKVAANQWARKL